MVLGKTADVTYTDQSGVMNNNSYLGLQNQDDGDLQINTTVTKKKGGLSVGGPSTFKKEFYGVNDNVSLHSYNTPDPFNKMPAHFSGDISH